ncbi:hypothetical protein G7047_06040 [Diaphorobacter sp. HDW4A]|uniref:hypothetical protein n=1 Tax=Diaphorobacter sp. HDW4A TaxID=2714924 RepID=UPI00140D9285|nr:hypothetical protein [Diaphorobacter sp. HDW4A]QIL79512.1 hypothetical protein G7047_06040 [Diaphorobacter sp. HDW4A]
METASLTFTLKRGQPQMLCTSDLHSLRCTQGTMQLEWEQRGIHFQHVLYGGGMPWEPRDLPAGTWVRLGVIGQASATLVQESPVQESSNGDLLESLLRALASALHMPTIFTKRNGRTG